MNKTTLENIELINIPKITDARGNLSVIEGNNCINYPIKRVYYLYDVPSDAYRGGHAHIRQLEFLIALGGSFDVMLNDGVNKKTVTLNRPNKGLLIPSGIWRELDNFSAGSLCLVLSSGEFLEEDYIREYGDFLSFKGA
jgi:WxcM-like, C-terminal